MRKVTNSTFKEIDDLYEELSENLTHYESLADQIKEQLTDWLGSFETDCGKNIFEVIGIIQDTKEQLSEHANDLVSSMESYQEERSEKWHSSDAGYNYTDWLEQWRDLYNTTSSPVYWFTLSGEIESEIEIDAGVEEIAAMPPQQPDYE